MLEDPRVDAVYIASEHGRHAQQVQLACAAGKHVLCEKPLATQMADAEAAVRGARQRGVVLAVCHPLRGVPTIESIRRAVSSGTIGQVGAARATYSLPIDFAHDDWHRCGPSAGVLSDISVHSVDTLRYVLEEMSSPSWPSAPNLTGGARQPR